MSSNKPYLIRAMYDWIVDNDLTPYILVNAEYPGVEVPQEFVNAGRIILNISPKSCRGLHLDNDRILFTTRFSGQTMQLFLSPVAVLAIYAKENGRGMEFGEEYDDTPPPAPAKSGSSAPAASRVRGKPVLKLVE
jgi:stringent starvation protein B